ncbi:MAG: pirin family protein [Myxococcota bacterium]
MQMEIRRSHDRGHANHGWLNSRHTFSFANYYDPRFMGFGPLRVINEDTVEPARGFGTHPHRDMEIISYVVAGQLGHKDTMGTGSVIVPGDVQLMSAGTGVAHSEMNPSDDESVHFLQIWIQPSELRTRPRYEQKSFPRTWDGVQLVVSQDGREGSLTIGQDIDLYRVLLRQGQSAAQTMARHRGWVQLIKGQLEVNGALLMAGDGLAIVDADAVTFKANEDVEALFFDMI